MKPDKGVPQKALIEAGLEMMRQNDRNLTKAPSRGRAQLYTLESGKTVRLRTCNDPVLLVSAEAPDPDAKLGIEGTDYLLIVLPQKKRTLGPVYAFLVPTQVAVDAVRKSHREWLESGPVTKGENVNWALWIDEDMAKPGHGYMRRWDEYRVPGEVDASDYVGGVRDHSIANPNAAEPYVVSGANDGLPQPLDRAPEMKKAEAEGEKLGDVIARAKREIAAAAGVDPANVRINVEA